jgi:hypothetical protein
VAATTTNATTTNEHIMSDIYDPKSFEPPDPYGKGAKPKSRRKAAVLATLLVGAVGAGAAMGLAFFDSTGSRPAVAVNGTSADSAIPPADPGSADSAIPPADPGSADSAIPPADPGSADPEPEATQVIIETDVDASGQPTNGYREVPSQSNVTQVSDCSTPSPAAVSDDIYYCAPSAAAADVCWPATPGSLLCVNDPWGKEEHRVQFAGVLPTVEPTDTPQPFALALDDGSHCRLRNGGAWSARPDGYVGAYICGSAPAVLMLPNQGDTAAIDRSQPVWTVEVGELGAPGTNFPPPQTRNVTTAWFAGNPDGAVSAPDSGDPTDPGAPPDSGDPTDPGSAPDGGDPTDPILGSPPDGGLIATDPGFLPDGGPGDTTVIIPGFPIPIPFGVGTTTGHIHCHAKDCHPTTDKGRDKGRDKGTDKGRDKGTDKGRDKGTDKGRDKGTDKGRDKGTDKGPTTDRHPPTADRHPPTAGGPHPTAGGRHPITSGP